jgi:hypothetical protein
MSFTSFFSTQAPGPVAEPLVATDALQSLVAPEIAEPIANAYVPVAAAPLDLELGFVPLPAPPPLIPPEPPQMLMAGAVAPVAAADEGIPKPRILMSREPGNSAFLVQLQTQN